MIDEKFLEDPRYGSRQMMRGLQTGSSFDKTVGVGGFVSKAQHVETSSRAQDLSVSSA